ncbi:Viral/Archaeal nuclease [Pyrodictium delaneyi]|uniref:Viral/Archaeal nuclease n=1 Tax=Pyrodictium delaneyi TaxID=1273541 RepID=A0A0N7JCR5_9CREN|nr:nuclease [Pyrodictium delaneyi]ALL00129.1 Viral/Archaeal nuclease [Pyrodictium delaneyi]OWJ54221.1 hypothetical protein Pdsh_06945 [Pyrodictium delaneyi]
MALDARQLKARYQQKWRIAARRELAVLNLLNILLPDGYVAIAAGLGTGTTDFIDRSYGSPLDAFDLVVLRGMDAVAFIDVTGFWSEQAARTVNGGKELCVGAWKLWKAQRFGLLDRAWIVHVADKRVSLRWLPLAALEAEKHMARLVHGERPYYCLPQQKWRDTSAFIRWLTAQAHA